MNNRPTLVPPDFAGREGTPAEKERQARPATGGVWPPPRKAGSQMLGWVLVFAILAIVAGALGFFALAGTLAVAAKILFVIFIVLLIVSFIMRALRGGPIA
jgi:uncharacterized membrane protein YtjA (UPF0391 family)